MPPFVPVTWSVDDPTAAAAEAEIVSVELTVPFAGGVTDGGANAQEIPVGGDAHARLTGEAKPERDVTVQTVAALPFCLTETEDGEHAIQNPVYVNVAGAEVPPGVVTVTLAAPATWGGIVATIVVGGVPPVTVAGNPSTRTEEPDSRLVPVIVTDVPPLAGPDDGAMLVILGGNGVL
jgi:hypothetical protein